MGKRIEFRFSGSGGQGIISAGIILAAAAVHDGKYAIQSQSYGPEARGGSSQAGVTTIMAVMLPGLACSIKYKAAQIAS